MLDFVATPPSIPEPFIAYSAPHARKEDNQSNSTSSAPATEGTTTKDSDATIPSTSTSSSRYSRPSTQNTAQLTKDSINKQLVDSIVKSVLKRRQEREKVMQLTRKRSISEDKEDLFEPEVDVKDGAIMEVSSFAIDHPFLDLNKDKEWLEHYKQSQKKESVQTPQPGFFKSIASTLRCAIDALNPFKRVETEEPRVNSNPFVYVNGNKEVNPAYLDYVHYRKQHPLPLPPKEKASVIQTETLPSLSPVPDVKLFLPEKHSLFHKNSVSSIGSSKTSSKEQTDLKEKAKSGSEENGRMQKAEKNNSKMSVAGSDKSAVERKQSDGKKDLGKAIPNERRKGFCLFDNA